MFPDTVNRRGAKQCIVSVGSIKLSGCVYACVARLHIWRPESIERGSETNVREGSRLIVEGDATSELDSYRRSQFKSRHQRAGGVSY